jgi:hypothetical protein
LCSAVEETSEIHEDRSGTHGQRDNRTTPEQANHCALTHDGISPETASPPKRRKSPWIRNHGAEPLASGI